MPRTRPQLRRQPLSVEVLERRQLLTADPIDLAMTQLGVAPLTDVEPGGSLTAGAHVNVSGSLPTNVAFRLYLSADSTLSPDDLPVFSSTVQTYDPRYAVPPIFSVDVPADAAPGNYHLIGMLDADNAVAESDETNNTLVADQVITVHAPADASSYVRQFNMVDMNGPDTGQHVAAGSAVTLYAYLSNFNDFYHIPVSFYLSPDGAPGSATGTFLAAGTATYAAGRMGVAVAPATLPADLTAGSYRLVAVADDGTRFVTPVTYDITNNTTDIALAAVSLANTVATPGSQLDLNLSFSINSTAPTTYKGLFDVSYYLSTDDILGNADDIALPGFMGNLHQHFAGSPDPASNYRFVFPRTDFTQPDFFTLPADLAPGTYHLFAVADPRNITGESDESNNTVRGPDVTVVAPDATVAPPEVATTASPAAGPGHAPPAVAAGSRARASLTLKNPGKAAINRNYAVRFFLSDDAKLSADDTLFSRRSIHAALPPGRNSLSLSYTLPRKTRLGTRYLIAVADALPPERAAAHPALVRSVVAGAAAHAQTITKIRVVAPRHAHG